MLPSVVETMRGGSWIGVGRGMPCSSPFSHTAGSDPERHWPSEGTLSARRPLRGRRDQPWRGEGRDEDFGGSHGHRLVEPLRADLMDWLSVSGPLRAANSSFRVSMAGHGLTRCIGTGASVSSGLQRTPPALQNFGLTISVTRSRRSNLPSAARARHGRPARRWPTMTLNSYGHLIPESSVSSWSNFRAAGHGGPPVLPSRARTGDHRAGP